MKIEDLTIEKIRKYVESKGISQNGNKKELIQKLQQKIIEEIEICWNGNSQPKKQQIADESDRLEEGVKSFIKSHEDEKMKILTSYDNFKIKKQKLKQRIEQQKQTVSNLPNIIRFTLATQELLISKSSLEQYPNSLLYTLISSNQFQPKENTYYLNVKEQDMIQILNFIRNQIHLDPNLNKEWGFSYPQYSNQHCLALKDTEFIISEDFRSDYVQFKQMVEEEIERQSDLLDSNFGQYYTQIKQLSELIYNDTIHLNVGGKIFTISKSKLEKHENTYFSPLVSGNWKLENDTHFIDRCFTHFDIIYEYLVTSQVELSLEDYFKGLNKEEQNIFVKDLDYYQLDGILNHFFSPFKESKILSKCGIEYVGRIYPGKWRLIPKNEITDTIHKTTVIVCRSVIVFGMFSTLTENVIDLSTEQNLVFECLCLDKRGQTESRDIPRHRQWKSGYYEIYEKIL